MNLFRPQGLLAGFGMFNAIPGVPELIHAGEQWAPHTFPINRHRHRHWELYLQASGDSVWHAQGQAYHVRPNALFMAPPGIEHELSHTSQTKHHFYFAAMDISEFQRRLPDLPQQWSQREIVLVEEAGVLIAPFRQLVRELSLELPYQAAGLKTALDSLILETSRLLLDRRQVNVVARYTHAAAVHAQQLIEQHLDRDWKVADIARMVGLSPGHLSDCFSRDIGMTVHRYLLECRVSAAEGLLATTELSVTEVALETGFSSSQYFSTAFRRLRGVSPSSYRATKFSGPERTARME